MCIVINKTDIPKYAIKDIPCNKIVFKKTKGIYLSKKGFEYIIRQCYTNNILEPSNHLFMSNGDKDATIKSENYCYLSKNLFHSYKNESISYNFLNRIIVTDCNNIKSKIKCIKCIIPKGAYYYENEYYYASEQIKILEEI